MLIFFLSIGVTYFYLKYTRLKSRAIEDALARKEKQDKRILDTFESLRIIALACIQDQCEISEASIRIRMLISSIDHFENSEFPYTFELYEKIKHFKTHEARKAMKKQDRYNEDKLRFKMEEEFGEKIKEECEKLLTMLKSQ